MEEKPPHPDKVRDDLGTEVVGRLILASLQSFSSLFLFCFVFTVCLVLPQLPPPKFG